MNWIKDNWKKIIGVVLVVGLVVGGGMIVKNMLSTDEETEPKVEMTAEERELAELDAKLAAIEAEKTAMAEKAATDARLKVEREEAKAIADSLKAKIPGLTDKLTKLSAEVADSTLEKAERKLVNAPLGSDLDKALGSDSLFPRWSAVRGLEPLTLDSVELRKMAIGLQKASIYLRKSPIELADAKTAEGLVAPVEKFFLDGPGADYLLRLEEADKLLAEATAATVDPAATGAQARFENAEMARAEAKEEADAVAKAKAEADAAAQAKQREAMYKVASTIPDQYLLNGTPMRKFMGEWTIDFVQGAAGDLNAPPEESVEALMLWRAYIGNYNGYKPKCPSPSFDKLVETWLAFRQYAQYCMEDHQPREMGSQVDVHGVAVKTVSEDLKTVRRRYNRDRAAMVLAIKRVVVKLTTPPATPPTKPPTTPPATPPGS